MEVSPWDRSLTSIQQRFPGRAGRVLQDRVFSLYVIEPTASIKFFTSSGERTFHRHPRNNREQSDAVARYADGILKHGLIAGVRGE
eukprot:11186470-Alexandrium_andersonii.AAC.1